MSRPRRTAALVGCAALAALAACAPGTQAASAPPLPAGAALRAELSPAGSAWVERTLASLTLREKVAQMVMPWVGGEYAAVDSPEFESVAKWVEQDRVGGLILSIGLPHSYAAKLNELQRRARVPLLITADMENGPGMRLAGVYSLPHLLPQGGGTVFPPAMALGATGSDSLAYETGRVLGEEARAVGVHLTFGPVLDVNSNPANPIINTRSFGEDPALVARLGAAFIRGAQERGLMTTAKHFPGHGDTEVDSHIDLPTISADRARLDAVELVPFRAAAEAGIDGMMIAHIAVVGVEGEDAPPASVSKHFVTGVLREEMGFGGLVFTDAMTMGGVAKRYGATEPLLLAVEAGADVLLMPRDVSVAVETVTRAVEAGRIAEARIDRSVRRILAAKARAGLPERRLVELDAVDEVVGTRPHRAVAEEIARRSITLARDQRGLVPLPAGARRVLSVTYAEVADLVAGRAFNRELAAGGAQVSSARVDDRTLPVEFEALRRRADSADVIVVSAYVSPREYRGTVGAQGGFPEFVEALSAAGKPVVAVTFGNPYLVSTYPSVPAYLLAWGGAEVSQRAAARALLGKEPITGTLPITIPPSLPRGTGIKRGM
ncbi:MAG TPA: glycoside hydrolase family 3 N-terminal domain-containing protein [Longimicrobiaceae bacterium]|nr:glycoside hydrolase family 3 N-terminal domain-containing protein [Longimicrobiaceae bacterium]